MSGEAMCAQYNSKERQSEGSRGSDAWLNFGHQRMAAVSDISAFNCNGDIEQARRFIHAEVQNILHTLSMVLSCHNALSPISRLPPEIILHIARFLSSVDPLGDSIGWVRVTHVCRRWRHIILENSCLWQDVPVNSRRWASEVIKRSQNAPLTVHCTFEPYGNTIAFEDILSQLSHIQDLSLEGKIGKVQCTSLNSALTHPAPTLRSFRVDLTVVPRDAWSPPDNLFDGAAPNLRQLSFRHACFPWQSVSMFQNLSSLEITEPRSRPSKGQMTDLLQATPYLRTLCLNHALPCVDEVPLWQRSSPRTVRLDLLEMLDITSNGPEFLDFMTYLEIPLSAQVRVHLEPLRACPLGELATDIIHVLAPFMTGSEGNKRASLPIQALHVWSACGLGLQVKAWRSQTDGTWPFQMVNPDISLAFDIESTGPIRQLIAETLSALCLQSLRSLEVWTDLALDEGHWRSTFPQLTNLVRAGLYNEAGASFVRELVGSPHGDTLAAGQHLAALRELRLGDVDFRDGLHSNLLDCLAMRVEHGMSLSVLEVMRSEITDGQVRDLRSFVGRLEWDKDCQRQL